MLQLYTIMAEGMDPPRAAHHFNSDAYGKMFSRRFRSLELTISNETSGVSLKFPGEDGEFFKTGTWFEHFCPRVVSPGTYSKGFVTNKSRAPTGVTGGLKFIIESTNDTEATAARPKYLIIGFTNPLLGCYKTFISITTNPNLGARHGYDNAENNTHKFKTVEGFNIEAYLTCPAEGGNKQMIFKISDSQNPH